MIWHISIIKDGIPLISKSFFDSQKSVFAQHDNLILISGFFSALNSFTDRFDDLGSISELKFDSKNNDLKICFLRDNNIPNLIFLASYDEKSKGVNVQHYLRKISNTFLKKYNIKQIINWNGKVEIFKGFEEIIKKYVEEYKHDSKLQFKEKKGNSFDNVSEKVNYDKGIQNPYNFVPFSEISDKKVNPIYYLTGEISYKVFNLINGKKSINQIAKELNVNQERVYNICKNLVKLGFIKLLEL